MNSENSQNSTIDHRKNRKQSTFNTELDPILFFHLFRKNIFWFFIIIMISLTGVYLYLRYTVPIYESKLIFQVVTSNTANQVLDVNNFQEKNDIAKDVEILKSKLLFKRALKRISVDVTYYNQGKILAYELYKSTPIKVTYNIKDSSVLGKSFFVKFITENSFKLMLEEKELGVFKSNFLIKRPELDLRITMLSNKLNEQSFENFQNSGLFFKINNLENLTDSYIPNLSVYPLNTYAKTVSIGFKDNNPLKCKDIVTAVAEEYIKYDIEERSKSSKKVLEFIDNQLDKYFNRLKVSEKKIENFQKNSNFKGINLSSTYFERSSKMEDNLIDIELKTNVLDEIKKSIVSELKNVDTYKLLPILAGTEYGADVATMIDDLKQLLSEKESIRYEVTGKSDALKSIEYKIDLQKKMLLESISSLINKLKLQKKAVIKQINEIDNKTINLPTQELEYARLQRVLSIDEKFFTLLMDKRTEYSISEAGFVPQHKILDKANVPSSPVFPKKTMIYVFGMLLGIMLSLFLLVIKYILKNTISSIDEIIRLSCASFSVLGIIPKYKHDIPISQLVVNRNPKSLIAESFRSIRSNLQFVDNNKGKKLIAITSTVSGEGKTFCAINIAGIIAFSGKKVVILDLDMRKPKIHLGFGVSNDVGMSTLLIDKNTIQECVFNSELENLDFITSGPVPPNPSELIISGKLDEIVEELKQTYDYVIIDNPPIGLVSDAMEMLKKADYPIYVFKNEYSNKNFVNNLDRLILDNKISKLSVILNAVEMGKGSYGSGYGYGQNYGYGYGYGYGSQGGYYDTQDVTLTKKTKIKNIFSFKK